MSKNHVVQQGEHLSGILKENGFRSPETIWDDPNNADLKARRDPHALFPGDVLFIPDLVAKVEPGGTTATHTFVVKSQPLFLRLNIRNLDNQPVRNAPSEFKAESEPDNLENGKTNDKGFVDPDPLIQPLERNAVLTVQMAAAAGKKAAPSTTDAALRFDLKIGNLNPETKLSGQQARLNNLGYFAGYTLNDLEQLLWAAEEFECDRLNFGRSTVAKRPELIGVGLADQKDGEELGDPKRETGIQNRALRDALRKAHGS